MKRFKLFALLTCLGLMATSPSYAGKHDDRRWDRDRHEYRHEHRDDRHHRKHERRRHEDRGRDRRSHWFHDNGYSRLSIPVNYYPGPGQCRFWYPGQPYSRQPAARRNCGAAPRGAWLIRQPRHDARHVHVIVNEPWRSGPQLIGEFEIGSGMFIRLLSDF